MNSTYVILGFRFQHRRQTHGGVESISRRLLVAKLSQPDKEQVDFMGILSPCFSPICLES